MKTIIPGLLKPAFLLLVSAITILSGQSYAQDKAIGLVEYELHQAYLSDKGLPTGQFLSGTSTLLVGQQSSLEYTTRLVSKNDFFKKNAVGETKHYTAEQVKKDPDLLKMFGSMIEPAKYDTSFTYKKYNSPGHSLSIINVMNSSLLNAYSNARINWALGTQSKMLNGLLLRNASASFRGRSWLVWYAPSIPAPTGPYGFSGLPGLIIEGADSTGEVNFLAKKIEFPTAPVVIAIPKPAYPVISQKDFDANQAAIVKSMRQLEKSSRAGNTVVPIQPLPKIAPLDKTQ